MNDMYCRLQLILIKPSSAYSVSISKCCLLGAGDKPQNLILNDKQSNKELLVPFGDY